MSKRHPLCALAVSPYYLDSTRWGVSTMTVTRNRKGKLIWINTGVLCHFLDQYSASKLGVQLSDNFNIPCYRSIKERDNVTDDERAELEIYGLLDHLKTKS